MHMPPLYSMVCIVGAQSSEQRGMKQIRFFADRHQLHGPCDVSVTSSRDPRLQVKMILSFQLNMSVNIS